MRRAARRDANHAEVERALRSIGASVQDLSRLGEGVPDLLVGFRRKNYVLEVKDGAKAPSDRRLTSSERDWFDRWAGQVGIVLGPEDAIELLLRLSLEPDEVDDWKRRRVVPLTHVCQPGFHDDSCVFCGEATR